MTAAEKLKWTENQYLEFERASQEKHEYFDGDIYAMSGGNAKHSIITGNTFTSLSLQLRGRSCLRHTNDMRIRINDSGDYTYPDMSVVCGQAQYLDDKQDTLLNPTLIIEVLSPSTERYDRGKKFQSYRQIPTLMEYILISQESPRIERYFRQTDGLWGLMDVIGLEAVAEFTSIGCTLALKDVYEDVVFEENPLES